MTRTCCMMAMTMALVGSSAARADDDFAWLVRGEIDSRESRQPGEQPNIESHPAHSPFGQADSWRWAIYTGAAHDFDEAEHYNLHFSAEYFIADYFSVNLELGALYFDQIQDTWGGNFNALLRWHFLQGETWTIYGDAGAGLLATGDDVPDGGTSFDFTPQAGLGATIAVGDNGARLITGLRWHHISNARTRGEENNPGRDALMAYIGLSFPWGN